MKGKTKDGKDFLSRIFWLSILIKFIDGIIDIVGSIFLYFISSLTMAGIIINLFQHELAHDPNDLVINYLVNVFQNLSRSTQLFAATYLLIHGFIKIGLSTALWKEKKWAYPLAGFLLILFGLYQTFRFSHTHSFVLLFLIIVDIVIISLLLREYHKFN